MRGELEGEQGGTCRNDKPGQMMGMMMGVEERSRSVAILAQAATLVQARLC